MEAECHLCRIRHDEINRLFEENAQLKRDLKADCYFCLNRPDENNHLLEENIQLKLELEEEKITFIIFLKDDAKGSFLLTYVRAYLPQRRRNTPFQMLLITSIRLGLELPINTLPTSFVSTEIQGQGYH